MRYRERGDGNATAGGVLTQQYLSQPPSTLRTYSWAVPSNTRRYRLDFSWDTLHKGPPWRSGGPMNIWSYTDGGCSPQPYNFEVVRGSYTYRYNGTALSTVMPSYFDSRIGLSAYLEGINAEDGSSDDFGDVSSEGASAWSKFAPGQPGADAGVFIAEALDISRMLKTTALGFLKLWKHLRSASGRKLSREAANQHLNTQFGWLPFVSDCKKFYHTHKHANKLIHQLVRDSGQWIHRSGVHRRANSADIIAIPGGETGNMLYPQFPWQIYSQVLPRGSCTLAKRTSTTVWFSGSFRYYVPDITGENWWPNMYRKLMGLTLNPKLVWELIPFSWLVDYYTNIGDVISNASDNGLVNNLVARYAYIMGHTEVSGSTRHVTNFNDGSSLERLFPVKVSRKQRVSANPFGFGLSPESLSARQYGILGALGLTRFLR